MVTIKDVAKECGVSIATVSNIINGKSKASTETCQKVLQVIKELDYTPNTIAKNLKQKTIKTIGIITEDLTVFNAVEIVDGINKYCEDNGYDFIIGNLRLNKKYKKEEYNSKECCSKIFEEFKLMQSKQVQGIIYIGSHCREIKGIPEEFPIPIVIAYSFVKNHYIPCITYNDKQGAYDATNELLGLGHSKIGIITGAKESLHTVQRLMGYQQALLDNNINLNDEFVQEGDWERKSGEMAAKQLVTKGATAIFVMNDVMAGGVYDCLQSLKLKVGKDIAVIGFDNREVSEAYNPPLSTMAIPLYEIGCRAGEILVDLIKEPSKKRENKFYEIDCTLVERKSH